MSAIENGESLYEYTVRLTRFTEYGFALASLLAGEPVPPQGARFDVVFEGSSSGPKLNGTVTGVDYAWVRADGRFQLHLHGRFHTDDGHAIALEATGFLVLREGGRIADVRENVTLFSSSKEYEWVNGLQVWAAGTSDFGEQTVRIKGYAA